MTSPEPSDIFTCPATRVQQLRVGRVEAPVLQRLLQVSGTDHRRAEVGSNIQGLRGADMEIVDHRFFSEYWVTAAGKQA